MPGLRPVSQRWFGFGDIGSDAVSAVEACSAVFPGTRQESFAGGFGSSLRLDLDAVDQQRLSSFPGATQLAGCLGIPTSIITDNPSTANSAEFDSKNQLQSVNDSVAVYPSAKAAEADHASLTNTKTPSCLTQVLNGSAREALASQFGSGTTLGNILVSRSPATEFAPGSANFTAFMPISTHGVTLNCRAHRRRLREEPI